LEKDGYKTTKIINPAPPTSNIIAVVKPIKSRIL
jgi:hypothetical protein